MIFSKLNYIKLKVHYRAVTKVFLTDNKGATLSGLFKTALRHICCDAQRDHCRPTKRNKNNPYEERFCPKAESCIYAFTAEHISSKGEDTVLPYVISCSNAKQRYIPQGSSFNFELVLLGKDVEYINEIIAGLISWEFYNIANFRAFYTSEEIEAFGRPDIWPDEIRPHGKLRLEKIDQILKNSNIPIYKADAIVQRPILESLEMKSAQKKDSMSKLKVNFISPVQLKKKKQIVCNDTINFDIFYHALSRRLTSLIKYFGSVADESIKKNELQYCHDMASEVSINHNHLKMEKMKRDTSKEFYNGFKGEIIFENVHSCFKPWIKAGELIHVGKFPTLGLGEFTARFF